MRGEVEMGVTWKGWVNLQEERPETPRGRTHRPLIYSPPMGSHGEGSCAGKALLFSKAHHQ